MYIQTLLQLKDKAEIVLVVNANDIEKNKTRSDGSMNHEELTRTFRDPPILETPRLYLRKMLRRDAGDMYEYACRPETSEYLTWEKHPYYSYTVELVRFFQKKYQLQEGREQSR